MGDAIVGLQAHARSRDVIPPADSVSRTFSGDGAAHRQLAGKARVLGDLDVSAADLIEHRQTVEASDDDAPAVCGEGQSRGGRREELAVDQVPLGIKDPQHGPRGQGQARSICGEGQGRQGRRRVLNLPQGNAVGAVQPGHVHAGPDVVPGRGDHPLTESIAGEERRSVGDQGQVPGPDRLEGLALGRGQGVTTADLGAPRRGPRHGILGQGEELRGARAGTDLQGPGHRPQGEVLEEGLDHPRVGGGQHHQARLARKTAGPHQFAPGGEGQVRRQPGRAQRGPVDPAHAGLEGVLGGAGSGRQETQGYQNGRETACTGDRGERALHGLQGAHDGDGRLHRSLHRYAHRGPGVEGPLGLGPQAPLLYIEAHRSPAGLWERSRGSLSAPRAGGTLLDAEGASRSERRAKLSGTRTQACFLLNITLTAPRRPRPDEQGREGREADAPPFFCLTPP